jgi:spermidine synthase
LYEAGPSATGSRGAMNGNAMRNDWSSLLRLAGAAMLTVLLLAPPIYGQTDNRKLLESKESLYNNIYVYQDGPYISMTFGQNRKIYTESIYNTVDPGELPVKYTQMMTATVMYPPHLDSILEIGFGGGRTASYLHQYLPDTQITSVELDPAVVELAKKYFAVKDDDHFKQVIKDGRLFLADNKDHYDIILIDAYRGPFVPFHLLTQQFYQLVKDHLTDGGVVAQNVEPTTMLFDSAVKTIHSVFPQIEFYSAEGNVVTVAYPGKFETQDELAKTAAERQAKYHFRYDLPTLLAARKRFPPDIGPMSPDAPVLTDDFAPVEALKAIERHNEKLPGE